MMIAPGTYKAKITDYSVVATKAGDPMVAVRFEWEGNHLTWYGLLRPAKEGNRNFTIESLLTLGLKSVNDIEKLVEGPSSKVLSLDNEFDIVVEHEEYNGKVSAKIKYINDNKFKNKMSVVELKGKLGDLRADFAQAWQARGAVQQKPAAAEATHIDDIPF